MNDNKQTAIARHELALKDRRSMTVSGVKEIVSFDEHRHVLPILQYGKNLIISFLLIHSDASCMHVCARLCAFLSFSH